MGFVIGIWLAIWLGSAVLHLSPLENFRGATIALSVLLIWREHKLAKAREWV